MVRVLHFMGSLMAAGLENVVIDYFKHIDHSKVMYDFCIIGTINDNFYEQYLLDLGCKIYKIHNDTINKKRVKRQLTEVLQNNKYDIVHIDEGFFLKATIAEVAHKCGVKHIIAHAHFSGLLGDRFRIVKHILVPFYRKKLNRLCQYKFACSEAAGRAMFGRSPFSIIRNAIDIDRFKYNNESRKLIRERYDIQDDVTLVGHIGRLAYPKNQMFILQVIEYLKNITDKFCIMFIGKGPDEQMLKAYVKENNYERYVLFVGSVGEEVNKYYSAFDVFLLPSFNEGLSLVVVEAQANGVSVIASNTISQEHKMTENFCFKSIKEIKANYIDWANTILNISLMRKSNEELLSQYGYNIEIEAKKLQSFYLEIGNGSCK